MPRGVVSRMSAPYPSGYQPETELTFEPDDSDNPDTATETAGSEEYQWDEPGAWDADDNFPFQEAFNPSSGYLDIHANGTGAQMAFIYYPVDPTWAQEVIADKSISQNGTFGSWDRYDLTSGSYTLNCTCDGESYTISGAPDDLGGYILLWTADNDLWACVYLNMVSSDDDTALMAKLAAANPDSWSDCKFTADLYP